MPDLKPPIPVATTVVWRNGEVLLGKRAKGTDGEGFWCTPGGKADTWHGLAHCAARENYEETGLSYPANRYRRLDCWEDYVAANGQHFLCVYFELEVLGVDEARCMEPDKFLGWSWWYPNGLPDAMFEGDRRAVLMSYVRRLGRCAP